MKQCITNKLGQLVASTMLILLASNTVFANDPDLNIHPTIAPFPETQLGTNSAPVTFTITNTHPSNVLNLTTVTLVGVNPTQFAIDTDNCNSQALAAAGGQCTIDVSYQPTEFGSKMARLQIATDATDTATLAAFLTNAEHPKDQAERRLPPVLFNLSNLPENMLSTSNFNVTWSILGYHDAYQSVVAFFDCNGIAAGLCGANYGDNFATSGLITQTSTTPQPAWTFNGHQATEHTFNFNFQPNAHISMSGAGNEIVVRFYRVNSQDQAAGEKSLSLIVPGNLSATYYDKEGRRLTKYLDFP